MLLEGNSIWPVNEVMHVISQRIVNCWENLKKILCKVTLSINVAQPLKQINLHVSQDELNSDLFLRHVTTQWKYLGQALSTLWLCHPSRVLGSTELWWQKEKLRVEIVHQLLINAFSGRGIQWQHLVTRSHKQQSVLDGPTGVKGRPPQDEPLWHKHYFESEATMNKNIN